MNSYNSIHEYLNDVLGNIENPTDTQIHNAKQAYWKLYFRQYRRDKRKERKEFTLGFSVEILKQINNKRGTLSISQFLYASVEQALANREMPIQDKSMLREINYRLMELIDLLEEQAGLPETILEKVEQLEEQFSNLLKTTNL